MRRSLLFAATGTLLLSLTACGDKEAAPPAANAKICDSTMASWWFDATGAAGLTGTRTGVAPLTNPTQSDGTYKSAECRVFSDGKEVASFKAELTTKSKAKATNGSIAKYPEAGKFSVANGSGAVEPETGDIGRAWWTCKTTVLRVELFKPKDKDSRDDLVKNLTQHLAEIAGCPGPDADA